MKLSGPAKSAVAITAVLAIAACSAEEDGSTADSSADGEGVNTDAPLYEELPEDIRDAGQITIAADTHPPYRTIADDGEITGIDPDLQDALVEQLGVPFDVQRTSGLDAILSGMLSGRYHAFNGPVRTTAEREEEFDAIVWMTTRTSYLYRTDEANEFSDPEALCGARVAGVSGSVTESQLELYSEWCADMDLEVPEFIGLEDTNSTILAINSDRADYAGTTQAAALDIQGQDPDAYEYIEQSDEQGAGTDLLAMFMPKDIDLSEPMLAAFQGIFENGEYDRIMEEWNLTEASVDEPSLNPMSNG